MLKISLGKYRGTNINVLKANVISVPDSLQKSCIAIFNTNSHKTITMETNLVLKPTATKQIKRIPMKLMTSLIYFSFLYECIDIFTSIGSLEKWTKLANIRMSMILPDS